MLLILKGCNVMSCIWVRPYIFNVERHLKIISLTFSFSVYRDLVIKKKSNLLEVINVIADLELYPSLSFLPLWAEPNLL